MPTVLIVDDEPDILLFVRINLELAGYDVREAGDGDEALTLLRQQPPDVMVLDVMMPKVDGWSVLMQLKADTDPAIRNIPVVMLTALSGPEDQVRGGIEGAVRYLPKPVT
ncbi:MAG TPA: response regulator, partial [Acidimicrobiales bacterium]